MNALAKVYQFPKGRGVDTENDAGYIKLHRKLEEQSFMQCPVKARVWTHLLMNATHKAYQTTLGATKVILSPGQLVSGRKKILEECFDQKLIKVTEDMIRGALDYFKREGMITTSSTRKGTVFTIVNWGKYQADNTAEKGDFSPQQIPQVNPQQETQAEASNHAALGEVQTDAFPNTSPKGTPTIQEDKSLKDNKLSSVHSDSDSGSAPAKAPAKRQTKPQEFKEFFAAYPDHRKGGTEAQAWKVWKSEKLTPEDGQAMIDWLTAAAQNQPMTWGKVAEGRFCLGITKFMRNHHWKTPVPAACFEQTTPTQQRMGINDFNHNDDRWVDLVGEML